MSLKTIVIHGTAGPIYRALLPIVGRWTRSEGLPDILSISVGRGDAVMVMTDGRLATYVENELNDSFQRYSRGVEDWPGGGHAPTSLRVEQVA